MRKLTTLLVVLTAACGRIGFGTVADGATEGSDGSEGLHPCNTAIDLGPVGAPFGSTGTQSWFATAAHGTRVLAAMSSLGGVYVTPIELGVSPPQHGAAGGVDMDVGSNLQIAVSDQRLMVTSSVAGGTRIAIADLMLITLPGSIDSVITVSAPDHAIADDNGGWLVASAGNDVARLDRLDRDGMRGTGASWPLADVRGISLARVDAGFVIDASDQRTGTTCLVRRIDAALVDRNMRTLATCQFIRVAAMADGSAVGFSYTEALVDSVMGVVLGPDLTSATGSVPLQLFATQYQPSRLTADANGFWVVAPVSMSTLRARLFTAEGTLGVEVDLAPYTAMGMSYQHDVVTVAGQAYAVWLSDSTASPRLHVARLCPG